MPGDFILLDNIAFDHSCYFGAVADAIGVELLFIPPRSPWLSPIEGGFSVVARNDRSTGRITDAFSKR
jgi:transposase